MVVGARGGESETSLHRDLANCIYNWFASYVTMFKVEDAQGKIDAYKNSPAGAAPANAGTGGSGGSTPPSNPLGTPTPYPL